MLFGLAIIAAGTLLGVAWLRERNQDLRIDVELLKVDLAQCRFDREQLRKRIDVLTNIERK